ncbi:hypothetical protein RUM43_013357 [Polyplax serrata]|uniref:Uncharacterized protein n=1 Tax=Polyplax serrata TaxID=468196 RepID=A0AAN8PHT3_POLSC
MAEFYSLRLKERKKKEIEERKLLRQQRKEAEEFVFKLAERSPLTIEHQDEFQCCDYPSEKILKQILQK